MRKSIKPLTPDQVYRYAVQVCQPHLKLGGPKKATGRMILTVLLAAAARISSLSDTCRRLRDVPDEHVIADALYATLPAYNVLRRRCTATCPRPCAAARKPPRWT